MRTPLLPLKGARNGLAIVEIVIAVALAVTIGAIAIPVARDALIAARGRASANNLQILEAAKRSFVVENPGVNLTNTSQLLPYLPGGILPSGISSGETYTNITGLNALVASSVNGNTNYEPWSTNYGIPTQNGFNDLANAVIPSFSQMTASVSALSNNTPVDLTNNTTITNPNSYSITLGAYSNGVATLGYYDTNYTWQTTVTPGTYTPGYTYVSFSATTNTGYSFGGWSGTVNSTNSSLSFNLTTNSTETPSFPVIYYSVTLITNVTGSLGGTGGTLSSGGTNSFPYSSTVSLTAVPTPTNYVFSGWNIGGVTTTNATTTFTITSNTVATGTFVPATYTLTTSFVLDGVSTPYPTNVINSLFISPAIGSSTYTAESTATVSASSGDSNWSFNGFTLDANTNEVNAGTGSDAFVMTSNHVIAAHFIYTPQQVLDLSASNVSVTEANFLNPSVTPFVTTTIVSPTTIARGTNVSLTTTITSSPGVTNAATYWVDLNSLGIALATNVTAASASVSTSVNFPAAPGVYTVTGHGASGSTTNAASSANVTVTDVAPSVSITPSVSSVYTGYPISIAAMATDPGNLNSTGTLSVSNAGFSQTFTNSGTFIVTNSTPGTYTVTLSATGPYGATASTTNSYSVSFYTIPITFSGSSAQIDRNATETFTITESDPLGYAVTNTLSWLNAGFTTNFNNSATVGPITITNIGASPASLVSVGHFGQVYTNTYSINVLRNLILYANTNVGTNSLYTLNLNGYSGYGSTALTGISSTALSNALAGIAFSTNSRTVATFGALYDDASSVSSIIGNQATSQAPLISLNYQGQAGDLAANDANLQSLNIQYYWPWAYQGLTDGIRSGSTPDVIYPVGSKAQNTIVYYYDQEIKYYQDQVQTNTTTKSYTDSAYLSIDADTGAIVGTNALVSAGTIISGNTGQVQATVGGTSAPDVTSSSHVNVNVGGYQYAGALSGNGITAIAVYNAAHPLNHLTTGQYYFYANWYNP